MMSAHPTGYVFWRTVRCMIREPDFNIDAGLLQSVQEDFDTWLAPCWFARLDNRAMFIGFLQRMLEDDCRNIDDVKAMLRAMQRLRFMPLFAQVVEQSLAVRHSLTRAVRDCDNGYLPRNALKQMFSEFAVALVSNAELEQAVSKEAEQDISCCDGGE